MTFTPSSSLRLLVVCACLAFTGRAADLHVATTGNDTTGNGTLAAPYKTIQKAASLAVAGDNVLIRGGTYRETVTPSFSGTAGNPITFQPYQNEAVVISGLDVISGAWTEEGAGSGLYYATMAADYFPSLLNQADQVFVNGAMMPQARWPDTTVSSLAYPTGKIPAVDYSHPAKSTLTAVISKTYDPVTRWVTWVFEDDRLAPATDGYYVGAEIYFQPSWDAWSWTIAGTVTAQTGKRLTVRTRGSGQQESLATTITIPPVGSRYFLFNQKQMADTPGEWWHDKVNGRLYHRGNPTGNVVEAKKRDFAFNLTNRAHIVVKNLSVVGATLALDYVTDGSYVADGASGPYAPYRADGTARYPGRSTSTVAPSNNITLDGLDVRYVSHFTDVSGHFFVQWGRFSGLLIAGSDHTVKNCRIRYSSGNGISVVGLRHKILNNRIEDVAASSNDTSAINTTGSLTRDHEIAYNTIRRTGRSGITPRGMKNSDPSVLLARIHHNDVGDCLLQDWDGAPLYTAGDDGQFLRIDHNLMHDTPHYSGIYLDFCKNYIVDHNVVWNVRTGIQLQGFYNTNATGDYDETSLNDILCYNNTLAVKNWHNGLFGPFGFGNSVGKNRGTVIQNNVVITLNPESSANFEGVANADDATSAGFADATKINNLVWDKIPASATDPRFVSTAAHDYRVLAGSPAIDTGDTVPSYDRGGVTVPAFNDSPVGSAPDRGAYEYGAAAWTAGSLLVTSDAAVAGRVGSAFQFAVTADPAPTAFAASGLPAGLAINASTGLITGTPAVAGAYAVSLTASRDNLSVVSALTVVIAPAGAPLVTNAVLTASGTVGDAFTPFQITADNAPTSFSAAGLPLGLSVDAATGVISGIPATATDGVHEVRIGATNAAGTTWKTLVLTIAPRTPPEITGVLSARAAVGAFFVYPVTATNSPTSFAASGLPAGLTLQPSGNITGTPTAAGTYTVTLTAANRFGSDTATLNLVVVASLAPAAHEGFGTSSGFSSAWTQLAGFGTVRETGANGVFPPLVTAGNSSIGSHCNHARTLSATLDPSVAPVYFSFLHLYRGWNGIGNNWEYLALMTAAGKSVGFGCRNDDGAIDANRIKILRDGSEVNDLGGLVSGTNYLYLSKLTHANGKLTIETWIYDDPATFPKRAPDGQGDAYAYATTTITATDFIINRVQLYDEERTGFGSSYGGFDEIRVGSSFESVTPRAVVPAITSAATAFAVANTAYPGYTVTALNSPTSFAASGLPAGLSINTATGAISGTPTQPGVYDVTLTATNSLGSDTLALAFTVYAEGTPLVYAWGLDGSGNWGLVNNWSIPLVPSATGANVTLGNGPATTAVLRTLTLDTHATLGALTVDATLGLTNAGYIINTSTAKELTFDATVGNATLVNPAGASSLRINTGVVLADTLAITAASTGDTGAVNNSASVFLAGAISGPGGIIKSGSGNLRLGSSAGQTFEGGVTLSQGQLILGTPGSGVSINALGAGLLTLSNASAHQIDHNNFKYAAAVPITLANPATLANPVRLQVAHASNSFVNWSINAFNQGALAFTGPWSSTAAVTSDVNFSAGGATGFVHAADRSAVTFSGNGKFWLKSGQHHVAHAHALGLNNAAPVRLGRDAGGDSVTNEASLYLNGNYVVNAALALNATGTDAANRQRLGAVIDGATGSFAGPVALTKEAAARTVELWSGASGVVTFSGVISDAGAAAVPNVFVKYGRGSVVFSAANTRDGATTINDGTLLIHGNQSSANGAITVAGPVAGATKSFSTGGANGATSVTLANTTGLVVGMAVSGANLQPHTYIRSISGNVINLTTPTIGQLAGTLTFSALDGGVLGGTGTHGGAVTVAAGGKLAFALSTTPGSHDRFDVSGALAFSGSSTLTITATAGATTGTYTLLNAAGGITGTLPTLVLPANWVATLSQSGNALNLVVTSIGLTPLQTWRQTHFGTTANTGTAADTHDADGDGAPNLLEYALATDPLVASAVSVPTPHVSGLNLQVSFLRARAELTYEVLASSDLATWSVIATNPGTVSLTEPVTVADPVSLADQPRRFLRLRVFE